MKTLSVILISLSLSLFASADAHVASRSVKEVSKGSYKVVKSVAVVGSYPVRHPVKTLKFVF